MEWDELFKNIRDFLPTATIGQDNEGQIIIYTDIWIADDGTLITSEET